MIQALAILQDSVRALRSRYLFWITLAISLLAALTLFGMIGFDDKGWKVLWFESNESVYRAGSKEARGLIAWIFNSLYVKWWLSWVAIVLALVSTASILPDFLAGGAIDLSLSKPISRFKLIALKIIGAMLFVAMQVSASVVLAWLLMGIKGVWLPEAFWAIPLILLQFLYLYAIAVLVAVLTRSTLASLLLTLIFWAGCSGVQFAANQVDSNIAQAEAMVPASERLIERMEAQARLRDRPLSMAERERIEILRSQKEMYESIHATLGPWQSAMTSMETLFPKTADIQKILANKAQAPGLTDLMDRSGFLEQQFAQMGIHDPEELAAMMEASRAGQDAIRQVHAGRSILTSLILPTIALSVAFVVFLRRDY